jgi:hypothetical protein
MEQWVIQSFNHHIWYFKTSVNPFYAAAISFDGFRSNLQEMRSKLKTKLQFLVFFSKGQIKYFWKQSFSTAQRECNINCAVFSDRLAA